jgi:hypothetical protein
MFKFDQGDNYSTQIDILNSWATDNIPGLSFRSETPDGSCWYYAVARSVAPQSRTHEEALQNMQPFTKQNLKYMFASRVYEKHKPRNVSDAADKIQTYLNEIKKFDVVFKNTLQKALNTVVSRNLAKDVDEFENVLIDEYLRLRSLSRGQNKWVTSAEAMACEMYARRPVIICTCRGLSDQVNVRWISGEHSGNDVFVAQRFIVNDPAAIVLAYIASDTALNAAYGKSSSLNSENITVHQDHYGSGKFDPLDNTTYKNIVTHLYRNRKVYDFKNAAEWRNEFNAHLKQAYAARSSDTTAAETLTTAADQDLYFETQTGPATCLMHAINNASQDSVITIEDIESLNPKTLRPYLTKSGVSDDFLRQCPKVAVKTFSPRLILPDELTSDRTAAARFATLLPVIVFYVNHYTAFVKSNTRYYYLDSLAKKPVEFDNQRAMHKFFTKKFTDTTKLVLYSLNPNVSLKSLDRTMQKGPTQTGTRCDSQDRDEISLLSSDNETDAEDDYQQNLIDQDVDKTKDIISLLSDDECTELTGQQQEKMEALYSTHDDLRFENQIELAKEYFKLYKKSFAVKASSKHGKGLFARKKLKPYTKIFYFGRYYPDQTTLDRCNFASDYGIASPDNEYVVDGGDADILKYNIAARINQGNEEEVNAVLLWDSEIMMPYVELTKTVRKNNEILTRYGKGFWRGKN